MYGLSRGERSRKKTGFSTARKIRLLMNQLRNYFLNFIEVFAKIGVLLEKTDVDDRRGIRETETHP
ncbi:MAG: hypothetical protein WA915_10615 [Candidatus Aminicenantaceae bacterium]